MKIIFNVTFKEGVTYDLPPLLANELIKAGYAEGRMVRIESPSRKIVVPGEHKDGRTTG